MTKALSIMSVEELEGEIQDMTRQRQKLREQALYAGQLLAKKLEARRVSRLLGRDVQIVEAKGIESAEAVGDAADA